MRGAPRPLLRMWGAASRGAALAVVLVAGAASAEITDAEYADPTTRYAHAVLGDNIEYAALVLTMADGTRLRAELPEDLVFEDVAPRLWDMDLDGTPEVVVVESSQTQGARLAIWDETGRIAATPHIGQRFRWLAPIGAADMDGDGKVEIAFVDRPHLAKTIRVWRYDGGLTQVASRPGFSNHRIGWDYIEGGLRDCGRGPEMVLASGNWDRVVAVRLEGRELTSDVLDTYSAKAVRRALACR